MRRYDVIVIGGGIVGLATAMALRERRPEAQILLLEREAELAGHQTGHNSGVVHSGVYYPPRSLKARMAVAGNRRIAEFCAAHDLPYRRTGKVVVATEARELPRLKELQRRGGANGVDARWLDAGALLEREPHVAGVAALEVGSAAICDYAEIARCYAALLTRGGVEIRTGCEVTGVQAHAGEQLVHHASGTERARCVVACGGLRSDLLLQASGTQPPVRIVPFRGEYYDLTDSAASLVRGLVYPVPDPRFPFLGVHLTPTVSGAVHAGPNAVPASGREAYRWRDGSLGEMAGLLGEPGMRALARRYWRHGAAELWRSCSRAAFLRQARRLVPELTAADLVPAGAGIRAQALRPDGTLVDDFLVHQTPGQVHVLNAPSPAATASLPIGEEIAARVCEHL